MKIKYEIIEDQAQLQKKINNLEYLAREQLCKIEDLHIEDLYFMSAIDKSIKLINSFIFAFNERNITVLAALTRIQIDCVLRTYATTLVNNSTDFCNKILRENQQINKFKDMNGKNLTDKYLCEKIGNLLDMDVYEIYCKTSGFIHFSSDSFHNIARTREDDQIELFISKTIREEDKETYTRLSIELANTFYFFGKILIELILKSWITQIKNEKENSI